MKILTWHHIENIIDTRLYGKLSKSHVGVYIIYCTAYGFLDHSLKEDCAIMTISTERSI